MNGYKEDLDTLLVFAGLFSSVVTAFVVESHGWLQADPADTTVALLSQIAQQMSSGASQSQSQPPPPPPPFTPSPAVVRINTFWFLSLTLALVDALFGLLCKQWVREQQRKIIARTPGQALTLRWLRLQSFERWHVPKILACLPILLEIALFLFFAGLLELLYIRNQILFAFTFTVIGIAVVFYLTTTLLPGIDILRQVFETHPYFATENLVFEPDDISRLPKIDKVCETGTLQQRPWTIEHWMEMLSHVRRVHQLPIQYFKSIPGTFPIPSNELKRTLDCSGTSESTLVGLLDTYEECWNGAHRFVKQRVVCVVSDHIHRVLPSGLDPLSPLSEEPDQLSSSPSSTFITSARGLAFLTFVNERFHKDFGLLDWCSQNTICRWVDTLERVRIHRRLPLGYFSPLPMQ